MPGRQVLGPGRQHRRRLWRYEAASPYDVSLCCGNVNRGVAVGHGKVYCPLDAHVVALDATTGEKVWDTTPVTSGRGERTVRRCS